MAVIDVGSEAIDRASYLSFTGGTAILLDNPANDTGILDTFEIWAYTDLSYVVCGSFSGSSTDYTSRDSETIGSVTSGSKQTFTGKNCDVNSGDFVGMYFSGKMERITSGSSGVYWKNSNQFGNGTQTYSLYDGDTISLYATGETAAVGNPYHYYLQQ